MRSNLRCLGLAALIALGAAPGAAAGERFVHGFHHGDSFGYGHGGYGFADAAIGGGYVGAPLTRFPRPSEIVPPAWGYGTFGVPTVTGIRQAPTAAPTLTVVDAVGPAQRRRGSGARILSRGADGRWATDGAGSDASPGGVHVISLTVPRR